MKELINLNPINPIIKCDCPKILIDDDDDCFNIMALEIVIKLAGLKCDSAYNGRGAIEKVLESQDKVLYWTESTVSSDSYGLQHAGDGWIRNY